MNSKLNSDSFDVNLGAKQGWILNPILQHLFDLLDALPKGITICDFTEKVLLYDWFGQQSLNNDWFSPWKLWLVALKLVYHNGARAPKNIKCMEQMKLKL